ncbi:RteC domain-containing protein [Chitinophaga arvensicola]|uniref:RteC protein n=1 Tax=Chitinophaga arvensicola TaxID=29529 RepID=A0A1I0PPF4_9BACT|nr:RteC domain-containing protein [Chitinophaga arvensicola]SEW16145.1 RteC protein [Chitinophaga arvensicola]
MVHLLSQQATDLAEHLKKIKDPNDLSSIIQCRHICLTACQDALDLCKGMADVAQADQIAAYKIHIPIIFGYYYHFSDLQEIHLNKPVGPASRIRVHYESWIRKMDAYRASHWMLSDYFRLDADNMDGAFFSVNNKTINYLFPEDPLWIVSGKIAPVSVILARFKGYEETEKYLLSQLSKVECLAPDGVKTENSLQWTASKAALVELIYALQEYGVFNQAKPEIGKITDFLSVVFNIDMANIYKMYENCRLRKKNRTPFLDALRNALMRRMDEDDLHAA